METFWLISSHSVPGFCQKRWVPVLCAGASCIRVMTVTLQCEIAEFHREVQDGGAGGRHEEDEAAERAVAAAVRDVRPVRDDKVSAVPLGPSEPREVPVLQASTAPCLRPPPQVSRKKGVAEA